MDKGNNGRKEKPAKPTKNSEPLCLFYYRQQDQKSNINNEAVRTSYEASTKRSKATRTQRGLRLAAKTLHTSSGDTDENETHPKTTVERPRPANDATRRQRHHKVKRFGRQPPYHLASYLLSSVKPIPTTQQLPPLTDVLTTIQEAWSSQNFQLARGTENEISKDEKSSMKLSNSQTNKMLEVPMNLMRRRSVPEEIIRKYAVSKEQTSPESETTVTMPEATSTSGKDGEDSTARVAETVKDMPITKREKISASYFANRVEDIDERNEYIERSFRIMKEPERSAEEGTSDSDSDAPGLKRFNTIKRAPLCRGSGIDDSRRRDLTTKEIDSQGLAIRVSQKDFYRNGQGILRPPVSEKCCQTEDCLNIAYHNGSNDSGPITAHDETESVDTSDTISSPTLCTRKLSSSDHQSSDSEDFPCTCAELTSSKDTSVDPYHSGKSTLSQTVSDNSVSTQDSTMSMNSITTGGSSISAESGSSSPDIDPKTSAKETTTSPDHTPRSPNNNNDHKGSSEFGDPSERKEYERDADHKEPHNRSCPRYNIMSNYQGANRHYRQNTAYNDTSRKENRAGDLILRTTKENAKQNDNNAQTIIKRSEDGEEVYSRFFNNCQESMGSLPLTTTGTVSLCSGIGSPYHSTENIYDHSLMVPRYSALPRSLSMLVNTSSMEMSHNSDSESITDSLEDEKNEASVIFYDTKNESKPVRGDINESITQRKKWKFYQPSGKAYFVSIEKEGEGEIVTDIYKIPEPPDKIKNNIFERHANICKNRTSRDKMHQQNITYTPKPTFTNKIRKERKKKLKKVTDKEQNLKKAEFPQVKRLKARNKKSQIKEGEKSTKDCSKLGEFAQEKFNRPENETLSKIPIFVKSPKNSQKKIDEKEQTTSIRQNSNKEADSHLTTSKPQAIIHPSATSSPLNSQVDLEALKRHRLSLISSLESTATLLKSQQQNVTSMRQQQWTKNQGVGTKRGNNKFQQKFEVIPEERSSSLSSSADDHIMEKDRRRSLPVKLTETSLNPNLLNRNMEGKSFRRYSLGSLSNYIVSKLMGRPLQAIPCVQRGPNNKNQQIIVFSPKDGQETNSAKGRDALIAMNREDFDRLSKGWMNFYLLKEDSEEDDTLREGLNNSNVLQDDHDILELKSEETTFSPKGSKIVCRIPSMVKDQTTSGSGTDETCASPGHCKSPNVNLANVERRYSFLLRDAGPDCFELLEYASEDEFATKSNRFKNNADSDKQINSLEKVDNTSTEIEQTYTKTCRETCSGVGIEIEKASFRNANNCKIIEERQLKQNVKMATSTNGRCDQNIKDENDKYRLSDELKFNSSNTVLPRSANIQMSPKGSRRGTNCSRRGFSLPELPTKPKKPQLKTHSVVESLPRVATTSGSEDLDSDSTVYLQVPSPEIPPLPLGDCCDCHSDDSSEEEEEPKIKLLQRQPKLTRLRTRATPDSRHSYNSNKSGWTVTVAGPVVFPDSTPDVQMRLSFPSRGAPPIVSQSDSGFVEDRSHAATQRKQEWTVTVKNPRAGRTKEKHKTVLPTLNKQATERTTQRVPKDTVKDLEIKTIVKKMPEIWSKVQGIIEEELQNWREETEWQQREENLLVSGRAMSFDHKPKITKMSDRDLTRYATARTNSVQWSSEVQE